MLKFYRFIVKILLPKKTPRDRYKTRKLLFHKLETKKCFLKKVHETFVRPEQD